MGTYRRDCAKRDPSTRTEEADVLSEVLQHIRPFRSCHPRVRWLRIWSIRRWSLFLLKTEYYRWTVKGTTVAHYSHNHAETIELSGHTNSQATLNPKYRIQQKYRPTSTQANRVPFSRSYKPKFRFHHSEKKESKRNEDRKSMYKRFKFVTMKDSSPRPPSRSCASSCYAWRQHPPWLSERTLAPCRPSWPSPAAAFSSQARPSWPTPARTPP
jgi:hypothetical protein